MSIYKKDIVCEKLKKLARFHGKSLSMLVSNIRSYTELQKKKLTDEIARLDALDDTGLESAFESLEIEFEIGDLEDSLELGSELAAIGLYKNIELRILHILETIFDDVNRRGLYKFSSLKKYLLSKGVDIESAVHYKEINELRLINNCLKHGAVVSKELASCPGWREGQEIRDLDKIFDNVILYTPLFIEHLVMLLEEVVECYTSPSVELLEKLNA